MWPPQTAAASVKVRMCRLNSFFLACKRDQQWKVEVIKENNVLYTKKTVKTIMVTNTGDVQSGDPCYHRTFIETYVVY